MLKPFTVSLLALLTLSSLGQAQQRAVSLQATLLPPSAEGTLPAMQQAQATTPRPQVLRLPSVDERTGKLLPFAPAPTNASVASSSGKSANLGIQQASLSCDPEPLEIPPSSRSTNTGYGRAEYLLWWLPGQKLPPLVSQSLPGTPQAGAGVLTTPGTTILAGNQNVNGDVRNGFRVTAGGWLNDCQTLGLEANFFLLEGLASHNTFGSNGSTILARPFVNETGKADAELVSFPGLLAGSAAVNARSGNLLGAGALLRQQLGCGCNECARLDLLFGYRYFQYGEGLAVTEQLTPLATPFVPGTRITVVDRFGTGYQFNGGVIGLDGQLRRGNWLFDVAARLDVGQVNREVGIFGTTTVAVPGAAPVTSVGGLLAQSSNIGTYRSSNWTVIPELELRAGYQLTQNLRVFTGYSLLVLTDFSRAASVIDTTVNRNLIPPGNGGGPARPQFTAPRSDLWINGLNLGVEYRF